ncbi:MAG: AmmeMemoRadiSam system protein B [Syntrophobacterales bacterium]|jgi:AmmeMemoRadiSam system protein B|nr:AmmeMemoRadiSam system protein B [Syntrophobacterales bacterium]
MEKPKLRWIDASPFDHEGTEMILLKDTEDIADHSLIVSKHAAFLLSLMDGTRTVEELKDEYQRTLGQIIEIEQVLGLVEAMDLNLFLMNDRFVSHFLRLKDEYEKAGVRESCLAGKGYPGERDELLAFLDRMLSTGEVPEPEGEVTGILAPHIDYGRGGYVYRRVYRYLKGAEKPLIVLLGTCHAFTQDMWNISEKDFATPIGIMPNSPELCGMIKARRELSKCVKEWPHRREHSIELQLPIIQFMTAGHKIEILPILTGSMHEQITGSKSLEDEEITIPLSSLKEVLKAYGKPYLVVAGADLAHMGAQFGDPFILDRKILSQSRKKDEAILEHVKNVNAYGFFNEVRMEEDRRRICGLTAIYFQLSLLEGSRSEIVGYDQWYDGRSSVSFAGGVFYAAD